MAYKILEIKILYNIVYILMVFLKRIILKLKKDSKTRGEHLFEGFYPVLTPIMFEESGSDRKRVMVILKHLDDETELDFSKGDMTRPYWTGSVDEPDVFVVAIGNNAKYTEQLDRLLRLAGTPSRLVYLDEWSVEEASAIIPIIRLGFKSLTLKNISCRS